MEAHFMSITIDDEIAELHVDKPWKAFPPAEYNEEDEFDTLLKENDDIFDVKVLADMVITIKTKIYMLYQGF